MTIDELKDVCSKVALDIESMTDISNAFYDFQKTNKITPKPQWTKVHDIYVTKVGESTVCIGTFTTMNGFSIQITGKYIDKLDEIANIDYETPEECMYAIEEALS